MRSSPAHMEKKPISLSLNAGISRSIFIQFFILSGNAKYGRPSTISKSPMRHKNNFIFNLSKKIPGNGIKKCNDIGNETGCQPVALTHIILDIVWHIIYLIIQLIMVLYYYLTYPSIKWITTFQTDILFSGIIYPYPDKIAKVVTGLAW